MILPTKHINFSESLLGLGSYLLDNLESPKSIDELWVKYKSDLNSGLYFAKHNFDNFILTILFLYSINAVSEKNGELVKCA